MSEDFREKLKAYREGRLTGEEREELEKELDKIEEYQAFLEEEMDNSKTKESEGESEVVDINAGKSERKIIKRAKWKARIHNALTAIGIVIVVSFACGVLTSLYYSTNKDISKIDIYRDVIRSTIAVTEPNLKLYGCSENTGTFFRMYLDGELCKQVGNDNIKIAEIDARFLFSRCDYVTRHWIANKKNSYQRDIFQYPGLTDKFDFEGDWKRMEKLPEGTVAEAYISLDKFYRTDDILKKFEGLNMLPLWFAVDTGEEKLIKQYKIPNFSVVGFPYEPIWHDADMKITSSSEKKGFLFNNIKTVSKASPTVESYGSGDVRNKNFIETLILLMEHEKIANNAAGYKLDLKERIDYIKSNGVNIYGVVVTGPTKEILKLRNEKWVSGIRVGDVELWNWTE